MEEGLPPAAARGDVPAPRIPAALLLAGILLPPVAAVLPILVLMVAAPTSDLAPQIGFGWMALCCLASVPLDAYLGVRVVQGRSAASTGSIAGGLLLGMAFGGLQIILGVFLFFAGCTCALGAGGLH